jgi:ElaB/YqjD/DUF883 family membrane-anchored ribosome-binding protein
VHPVPDASPSSAAARVRHFRNNAVTSLSKQSPWLWVAIGAVVLIVVGWFVARRLRTHAVTLDHEEPA